MLEVITLLVEGTLPKDEKKAKELALTKTQYEIVDDVLYHVEADKTLRVIPPEKDREKLFHEAHDGAFGAHLRDAKVQST